MLRYVMVNDAYSWLMVIYMYICIYDICIYIRRCLYTFDWMSGCLIDRFIDCLTRLAEFYFGWGIDSVIGWLVDCLNKCLHEPVSNWAWRAAKWNVGSMVPTKLELNCRHAASTQSTQTFQWKAWFLICIEACMVFMAYVEHCVVHGWIYCEFLSVSRFTAAPREGEGETAEGTHWGHFWGVIRHGVIICGRSSC